eukprot:4724539-Pleurochrysis_carterae.AAC.3
MTSVDVFSAGVVLRVVGEIDHRQVVYGQGSSSPRGVDAEFREERAEINGLLGGIGGGAYFGLARRQGDDRLLFQGPRNRRLPVGKDVARGRVPRGPIRIGVPAHFVAIDGGVSQSEFTVMVQVHQHTAGLGQGLRSGATHGATEHT